jgi:eukaryotic-like serine/threonine-protein kinase
MLEPNTLLQNRYLVLRELGRGGMGAVYQAVDQRFGSTVAIKQTLVAGDQLARAFEREARLLNSLRHAALPVVTDYFLDPQGQFLVMQFIPGLDLAELLARNGGPFRVALVMEWADKLLGALEYLHTRTPPIIHRDIKPQNLKLTPEGEIVLLDFGLAKGSLDHMTRAATSVVGYTPSFAALEQIRGQGTDERSDLYSLAATLYMLMTGAMPADALARADAVLQEGPDPLRPAHEVNPAVPAQVAAVLRRALALKRDQRPESAAQMRTMLRDAASGVLPLPAASPGATVAAPPPGVSPLAHLGTPTVPNAPPTRAHADRGRPTVSEPPSTAHARPAPAPSRALPFALGVFAAIVLLGAAVVGAYFAFVNGEDSGDRAATNAPPANAANSAPAVTNEANGVEPAPANANVAPPAGNANTNAPAAPASNANANRPPPENANTNPATNRPGSGNANSNAPSQDEPDSEEERPDQNDEDGNDRPRGRRPVRVSGAELESKAVRRSYPLYTDEMREEGARGPVMVDVLVSESGEVLRARVASGHPLLHEKALAAARRWRFAPTLVDSEPVKVFGTLRIPYQEERPRDGRTRDGRRRERPRE